MVTDPVRITGVHCSWWGCFGRCAPASAIRGALTRLLRDLHTTYGPHGREPLGALERSQWTGLRLSLTMPPPTSLGGEFLSRHAP